MTQDENSPEVFLGPTGSETEEFYTFQRNNPGLEKAKYLEWFQDRFNKEIELRRRRSDQPSDLEYMVIKKRSKYRERIGEESAELCKHSEENPHKTYRELAEWFQDRFGKEIDITAISRAIKRNRQEAESAATPPHPDQTPPAAKRSRRSINNPPASGQAASQPGMGAMSTFSVEMGNHPHSAQDTPNITPTDTPKNTYARISSPNGPAHLHNSTPQAVYPHRVRSGQSGSPTREPLPTPVWTAVNPGPGQPQSQPPAPPSANYVPGPPPLPPPPLQPRTNYAPTPQAARPTPAPVGPPTAGPPPVGPPTVASTLAPRPPYSPGRDIASHLQARLTSALEKQTRGVDELRQVQNEIHGLLNERHSAEQRRLEDHQATVIEKNNLREENGRLRSWGEDLQRGNLELQEFERRYQENAKQISQLSDHNQYLQEKATSAERKIQELESQLENARKGGHNNPATNGSLTSVKDMDELVQSHFSTSAKHAAKLSSLVDDVESANSKDLSGRISTLKAYLGQVNEQRDSQKNEWKVVFGRIASGDGRAKEYGGGKVNGARKETNGIPEAMKEMKEETDKMDTD